jgi:hypothetical protein
MLAQQPTAQERQSCRSGATQEVLKNQRDDPRTALLCSCFLLRLRQNARTARRNAVARRIIQDGDETGDTGDYMNIQQAGHEANFPLADEELRREREEEARKIRRLQLMISMVMSVISQDPSLTLEEASELAAGAKRAALAMFPDKELAYDLLYKPRLQRLMRERFRLQ